MGHFFQFLWDHCRAPSNRFQTLVGAVDTTRITPWMTKCTHTDPPASTRDRPAQISALPSSMRTGTSEFRALFFFCLGPGSALCLLAARICRGCAEWSPPCKTGEDSRGRRRSPLCWPFFCCCLFLTPSSRLFCSFLFTFHGFPSSPSSQHHHRHVEQGKSARRQQWRRQRRCIMVCRGRLGTPGATGQAHNDHTL